MFAPTKTYRRWHRKVNKNQRRYAIASAVAATGSTALVLARGHRVGRIPELPLVVSNETIVPLAKTSSAVKLLKALKAYRDVLKAKESKKIRAGKGKMRNRRYVHRLGPLIVYDQRGPLCQAFRNLPGVEMCNVNHLNLLQLAPGGHLGRFVIWTRGAFERLNALYGTYRKASTLKIGYRLPRTVIANSDLNRLINSQEIQSHLRPKKHQKKFAVHKKNPLRNLGVMLKLNPYAKTLRRRELVRALLSRNKKNDAIAKRKAAAAAGGDAAPKPKPKAAPKKKREGKNVRRGVKMNPHKKTFVKSLRSNK